MSTQRQPIRVLVVEDSPVARALLVHILSEDAQIEVVGEAADGHEAVMLTSRRRPDVILMDVVMPRMDGLEATRTIMARQPTPIVLVTASHDIEDGKSFDALQAGALMLAAKPPGPQARTFGQEAAALRMTVKLMSEIKVVRRRPAQRDHAARHAPAHIRSRAVEIVAIAASTGGPAALATILSDLPAPAPVPILVVQHITTGFHLGLVDWLRSASKLDVRLGVEVRGRVALSSDPPIGGHRPSATHLFRSVAKAYGSGALGTILTGMGDDGAAGLRTLSEAGGVVFAQDKATSVVYGMPREAAVLGVADEVLPLGEIAGALTSMWTGGRSR